MQPSDKFFISLFFCLAAVCTSCDEGRLYEDSVSHSSDGLTVSIKADILNAASWPSTYTVSIGAFTEESEYALTSKAIGIKSEESGLYEVTLSNIPEEAQTIEICVVNRLGQRIASFLEEKTDGRTSYEISPPQPVDVNMFDVIQNEIFSTTCANCHGASNFAAANLYLTQGKSYDNLVDVESEKIADGSLRVKKGSRAGSILYRILTEDLSQNWNYDHSAEIPRYNMLELIGAWIDNGAKQ